VLLACGCARTGPAPGTPTAAPTIATVAIHTPPVTVTPPAGYRLAGIAMAEPDAFAVFEAPNGSTALYRLNDAVPGLGRVMQIETERVVIEGERGSFELWLTPASTATAAPRAQLTPSAAATRRGAGTNRAPTPSGAPGPPAS